MAITAIGIAARAITARAVTARAIALCSAQMDPGERNNGFRDRRSWAEFTVSGERDGEIYLVRARGELDMATEGDLAAELGRAIATDAEQILLDLTGVTFIDSMGIHLLVRTQRKTAGRLRLLPVEGEVRRLLELTGVANYLEFVAQPPERVRG
jgi:anti-sigma B factor antagonist